MGLPIDLAFIESGSFRLTQRYRICVDDAYFRDLRKGWGQGLRRVFNDLPAPDWLQFEQRPG